MLRLFLLWLPLVLVSQSLAAQESSAAAGATAHEDPPAALSTAGSVPALSGWYVTPLAPAPYTLSTPEPEGSDRLVPALIMATQLGGCVFAGYQGGKRLGPAGAGLGCVMGFVVVASFLGLLELLPGD